MLTACPLVYLSVLQAVYMIPGVYCTLTKVVNSPFVTYGKYQHNHTLVIERIFPSKPISKI